MPEEVAKKKKQLTKEGYDKLIAERKEINEKKLPAILKTIAEAKAMGDLSENFEYKSALEEKDLVNSRLKEINELLDNVEIIDGIDDKDINKKKVGFWSKVTIQMDNSDPKTVIIVGTWEVDIKDDIIYISFESPLGKALNGRKKGDVFRLKTEANSEVKILEIE